MSDSSDGDGGRHSCLSTILHKCIRVEKQKIEDLASSLLSRKIIDKDLKNIFDRLVEQGQLQEALNEMLHTIARQQKVEEIPECLKDCNVPEKVVDLARLATQGSADLFMDLVAAWDVLVEHKEEFKREAEIVWPNIEKTTEDWPIDFLRFCGSEATPDDLRCYLESSRLTKLLRIDVDDSNPTATESTETDLVERSRRTADTDETDSGFVIVPTAQRATGELGEGSSDPVDANETISADTLAQGQKKFSDPVGAEPSQVVQPMKMDHRIPDYDPQNYQDDSGGQKASQYGEDIGADFLSENCDEIKASRDILLPVVELLWPENKELTDCDNWPKEFMQAVRDSDNETLLRHLANVFKYLLDLKKVVPNLKPATTLDRAQLEDWVSNNASNLGQTGNEIFKMLFAIAWPEIKKNHPDSSFEKNLLVLSETQDPKLGIFVSLAQAIISRLSSDTVEENRKERDESGTTEEPRSPSSITDAEHDFDRTFFPDNYHEIEAAREILTPVVQLMCPGNEMLTNRDNWPEELMQAVSDSDNETLLRHLANVFRCLLDIKKCFPDRKLAAPLDHAKLEEWILNNASSLTGSEIFKKLFAIGWPELEKNRPDSLFENMLHLLKTQDPKLGIFVSLVQAIISRVFLDTIAEEEKTKERNEPETTEEPTTPTAITNPECDFDMAFFADASNQIEASRVILAPMVQLMWPGNEVLTTEEGWPWELMSGLASSENVSLIHQLAKIINWLLQIKKDYPEMTPPARLSPSEARIWISKNVPRFKDSEQTFDIYETLLSATWPGIEIFKPWEDHLLEMLAKDENTAIGFITVAAMMLVSGGAVASGTPEPDEESEKELFARKIAGHQAILLPMVKLTWPARNELTAENEWPQKLMDVLYGGEDPLLVKRFKDICEWFLRTKQNAPKLEPEVRMTQAQTREWILLAPAEIQKSEERVNALAQLFELSWPEDVGVTDPCEWTKFLLRQYKQDMERATNFVDASRMILRLYDASVGEGAAQPPEIQGLPDDFKTVNENYDMMASSRDILTPFVRLLWPDKVELLDEKYWPVDILAGFANSEDPLQCDKYAEVLRHVVPMRNAAPEFRANASFDSYEARGWMMRAPQKLGYSDEAIAGFEMLYRIAWPETDSIPPNETWTYTLLQNYKSDVKRATDFANAADLISSLSKAATGQEKQPTEEFESLLEFFNSRYDEIRASQDIMLKIAALAWPDDAALTDQGTWLEALISNATSTKMEEVSACFTDICRNILKMKKHASEYKPTPLPKNEVDVKRWFMKGPKAFMGNQEKLFSDLLKVTWPKERTEPAKWTGFLFKRDKDDKDKVIKFVDVGESITQLMKAASKLRKSRKDTTSTSQKPETTTHQHRESPQNPPRVHVMQTRSKISSTSSSSPKTALENKPKKQSFPTSGEKLGLVHPVPPGGQPMLDSRAEAFFHRKEKSEETLMGSASPETASDTQPKIQDVTALIKSVRRVDIPPNTKKQTEVDGSSVHLITGQDARHMGPAPHFGRPLQDSRAEGLALSASGQTQRMHTESQQKYLTDGQMSTSYGMAASWWQQQYAVHTEAQQKHLTDGQMWTSYGMAARWWQQQFVGEWLKVRVAVIGIRPEESVYMAYEETYFPMYPLSNSVYYQLLPRKNRLTYFYTVYNKLHQTWRQDQSPGVQSRVVEPRGRERAITSNNIELETGATTLISLGLYIFDAACFETTHKPLATVWAELMRRHLPLPGEELMQSNLLHPEIAGLLEQIQCGWKVFKQSQEERTVKADQRTITHQVLITWLQSLHQQERVLASIAIAFVINRQKYVAEEILLKNLATGMRIASMSTSEQSLLYRKIHITFSSETSAVADTIITMLRSICYVDVTWILGVPLFCMMKNNGSLPYSWDCHMNDKMPLLSEEESFLKDIPVDWSTKASRYENKNYQENLFRLATDLKKIVETSPWMAIPYQHLLKSENIARLVANGSEIVKTFQLDSLLKKMLNHLDNLHREGKNPKHLLVKTREHFKEMFKHAHSIVGCFSEDDMSSSVLAMNVALTLIVKSLETDKAWNKKHVHFCVQLSALLSDWVFRLCKRMQRTTAELTEDILGKILNRILHKTRDSDLKKSQEFEFWEKIIGAEWHEDFKSYWVQAIQAEIELRIEKIWPKYHDFLTFYTEKIMKQDVSEDLEFCFEEKAVKCTECLIAAETSKESGKKSFRKIKTALLGPSAKKSFLEKLFLRRTQKHEITENDSDVNKLLRFACDWPIATDFFRKFNNEESRQKMKKAKPILDNFEKLCKAFVYSLTIKKVTTADLNVISKDEVSKICEFLELYVEPTIGYTAHGLKSKILELIEKRDTFYKEYNRFTMFFNMCKKMEGVDMEECEKIKSIYDDALNSKLLCDFFTRDNVSAEPGRFYGLRKKDMEDIALMDTVKTSCVFDNLWMEMLAKYSIACNASSGKPVNRALIDWKVVLREIWKTVKRELCNLVEEISQESLKLSLVIHRFSLTNGEISRIREELTKLSEFYQEAGSAVSKGTAGSLTQAAKLIHNVFEIERDNQRLKWFLEYKRKFNLKGDFKLLESVVNSEKKDSTLHDIAKDTSKLFPQELRKITSEKLEVLQTFSSQHGLISWLQETKMKDTHEVKIMCDLATASAGETPIETDRWMCLLSAVQGFSPLLFQLNTINSLDELLSRCKEVWQHVEEDNKFMKKWNDTGSQLQWFREKQSLYGSDQKLSLRYAQDINERGVYTVGNQTEEHPTLDKAISLALRPPEVSPRRQGENRRGKNPETFDLHRLQDLQSKLALIAGKDDEGQQDIAQFVDIFSAVKTLGESFINLIDAGCMLFNNWTAVISSAPYKTADRQNEYNLTLIICFMENSKPLSGLASLSLLNDLSKTLRQMYHQWTEYISNKRLQHYYLNEYNIQQITYMCHQLANVTLLPDQVFALLSKDPRRLAPAMIRDALDQAIRIEDLQEPRDRGQENRREDGAVSELERKKRTIRLLVNRERLPEDLAKAAVQAKGHEDYDACSSWALLHEYDEDEVEEKLRQYNEENAYAHERNEEEELVDVLHNRTVNSLTEMIDQILKTTPVGDSVKLVGSVKTICRRYYETTSVLTLQDYLSIDHLGKLLTNLYAETEVNPTVNRIMPDPMEHGKPNLIVCPEGETLPILLSLYMNNPKEPLPTTSEVLLCSETTTVDDVERFMRRAMCISKHNGKPMFCMGYSEKLSFNVSRALENFFEDLSHQDRYIDQNYQLVFISSSQQHYMTECFDKYQVQRWPKHSAMEISQYLNEHLAPDATTDDKFGASIVKIVASNRSGVGKSLFVKNLSAALDIKWYQSSKIDHMDALIKVLERDEDAPQLPGRVMPGQLTHGKPNLIHCSEAEILPVLMALYMKNPEDPRPTSSEILLCCQQTTGQEIEGFMRRAMCNLDKENSIFTIAFGERLTPSTASQIKVLSETLANNMHGRSDYQLVILSSNLSQFFWCEKFKLTEGSNICDSRHISAYLSGRELQGTANIVLQKIACKLEEARRKDSAAVPEPTQVWHKTTVRLLEKAIDTNHVLKKLYREKHFRNGDNHFIHIDLTPAVENGIERFMFNLLILGTIQDDSGRVWNRQKQHLYVIERTESVLNQGQVAENSILGMLPQTYCKSPKESLEKLEIVRQRVKEALEQHLLPFNRDEKPGFQALQNYITGSKFSVESFQYNEKNFEQKRDALSKIMYLAGFPSSVVSSIRQEFTEELRERLLKIYDEEKLTSMVLMNHAQFVSTDFQRPYQYLKYCRDKEDADPLTKNDLNLDDFQYRQPAGTPEDCIHTILQTGALGMNPSWAQLKHFTMFMNMQLQNCEESQFCQKVSTVRNNVFGWQDTELRGLKAFAVKFMMRMSQDFATPSLDIADQSSKDADVEAITTHQVRSRWEEKCHPYVFFNEDRSTMTFINVSLNSSGDLLDEEDNILERNIASPSLIEALQEQEVKFGFNFHLLSRRNKLDILRTVMGLPHSEEDPDPTYELTTDNVLKILAIYMRMRCNIPVIIMGETGCGKTRLVEFMSKLRSQGVPDVKNMVTQKIHGGVTAKDIYASVKKANQLAAKNAARKISTVLFYDEANTTTGIYAIKEVVCDGTVNGESFQGSHLQIVAACNPYKELSEKAITILEKSGLGYRVSESETSKSLGIPMRRLVYKVVALPPGVQPFVWDFGELSIETEKKYIRQMTGHLQKSLNLSNDDKELVDFVFCAAQSYMKREMKDECRYVSLRDIERCMKFFAFFHDQKEFLFPKIQHLLEEEYGDDAKPPTISSTLRCLIQTIGVCYHASLHERKKFRQHITKLFHQRAVNMTERDMAKELIGCQNVFLDNIKIEKDIAPNEALRENVFLITICTQLGIPLFLVGKPGSSKSLARTIVAANMDGKNSNSALYRRLKQIKMVTYQCSALTNAKGIQAIFEQCADLQQSRNLNEFAAVVVLDEIGLAEDSPNMPLKILHPLLECGSTTSGTLTDTSPETKVGFVGISNWALDPAKINRGIFVTRSTPSKADLLETAKGIMKREFRLMNEETEILRKLTEIYLEIYNNQIQTLAKEYFGLRDYYALIKMVNSNSAKKVRCDLEDVAYAVQRNFGGGRQSYSESFTTAVEGHFVGETAEEALVQNMIRQNLEEQDTRFLLLLTAQHASVALLEHVIRNFSGKVQVIYGSSFPGDHNFTEICKNINRIKVCMETGGIVVLLDMVEIHESLYDALNQHYTTYGGQRYVDIGLGGNRVPCRIADDFRLIVVEQKGVVYSEYPIPLINRLEKHHLTSESLLSDSQKQLAMDLTKWAKTFSKCTAGPFAEKDAFVGYHADTASSLVLSQGSDESLDTCKGILLQAAAVDAMFRASQNPLLAEKDTLLRIYIEEQVHDSLGNLLQNRIETCRGRLSVIEVTSFSNILTERDRQKIGNSLQLQPNSIMLLSLQQFDTQQAYFARLDTFFSDSKELSQQDIKVLLIQCPQAEKHGSLLACAKYCVTNRLKDVVSQGTVIIAFLLSTQRRHGNDRDAKQQVIVQHGATTEFIYVDDMRPTGSRNTVVSQFYNKSLTGILQIGERELKATGEIGENTINFIGLLKDSICQAMAKIRRGNRTDYRNLKCIQLLTRLCSHDEGLGHEFRCILVQKMIEIYSDREKDVGRVVSSWITKESHSAKNLQEGGTFGKTLCLCLKRHLADLLAFIISMADENNNLDFLLTEASHSWKQELWFMVFAAYKTEWSCMNGLQEFQVQILSHLPHDYSPQLPFSSVLNNIFEVQWDIVRNKEETAKVKVFFNQFRERSEYQILQSLFTNNKMDEAVRSYAADVIRCLFDFSKIGEVGQEWLTRILLAIVDKKKEKLIQEEIYQKGDDLTIVYYSYKQHFKHLSMLHDIFKVCPDLVLQVNGWICEQQKKKSSLYTSWL